MCGTFIPFRDFCLFFRKPTLVFGVLPDHTSALCQIKLGDEEYHIYRDEDSDLCSIGLSFKPQTTSLKWMEIVISNHFLKIWNHHHQTFQVPDPCFYPQTFQVLKMLRNPQPKKLYGWKAYERENENPTKKKGSGSFLDFRYLKFSWWLYANFAASLFIQEVVEFFSWKTHWRRSSKQQKKHTHTHTTLNRSSFSQQELEEKKHENLRILLKMFLRTLWASSMRNERLKKQPVPTWKKQKSDFENLEEVETAPVLVGTDYRPVAGFYWQKQWGSHNKSWAKSATFWVDRRVFQCSLFKSYCKPFSKGRLAKFI